MLLARTLVAIGIIGLAIGLCPAGPFTGDQEESRPGPAVTESLAADPIHSPQALEGRALPNLVAFTRLLGYVRYFHPSDEATWADWDEVAVAGVQAVESAESPEALARALERAFQPLGPTIRVFPTGQTPPVPAEVASPPDRSKLKVAYWRHYGCGQGDSRSIYRSERVFATVESGLASLLPWKWGGDDRPDPAEPIVVDLGGGVSCMVPLAVYADADGTIPDLNSAEGAGSAARTQPQYSGDDRETRLADVALCWNVMQHFYPYFDVVDVDWSEELERALVSAATDADEQAFLATLRRMIAALRDGHGYVYHPCDEQTWAPPFLWGWIEGQLVVTYVDGEAADLKPGDIVTAVDGQPVEQALAAVEDLISAAHPPRLRHRGVGALALGKEGETITLTVKRADESLRTVAVARTLPAGELKLPRPSKIEELRPGVFYIDIDRVDDADLEEVLPRLVNAEGVIYDFRGYPRHVHSTEWISHLIRQTVRSAQWHVPIVTRPDRQKLRFDHRNDWQIAPGQPYIEAPRVFLIDATAISYAESCLGIIEHYKLGELVGEPTAGTNGNINPVTLPGGYRAIWTGMKVLKQDGSRHHGVGILPTVPVSRTIAGVAAGRDEQLERAIELLTDGRTR